MSIPVVVFNHAEIPNLLKEYGFSIHKVKNEERVYWPKSRGGRVHCHGCDQEITVKNIGLIAPGFGNTKEVFCSNPACFSSWLRLHNF